MGAGPSAAQVEAWAEAAVYSVGGTRDNPIAFIKAWKDVSESDRPQLVAGVVEIQKGDTALIYAARHGALNTLKVLVKDLACPLEGTNQGGATAVFLACQEGHLEIVKYLARCGANLEAKDVTGVSPLHIAVIMGQLHIVQYLVVDCKVDANIRMQDGGAPVHLAVLHRRHEILEFLISHGANLEATMDDGSTPLHIACLKGHIEAVKLLAGTRKANVESSLEDGTTPLVVACRNGHLDVVKYLVEECGANIEATSIRGWRPIHIAVYFHRVDVTEYLLQKGADAFAKTLTSSAEIRADSSIVDIARRRGYGRVVAMLNAHLAALTPVTVSSPSSEEAVHHPPADDALSQSPPDDSTMPSVNISLDKSSDSNVHT